MTAKKGKTYKMYGRLLDEIKAAGLTKKEIADFIGVEPSNFSLPLKARGQGVAVAALRRVINAAKEYAVDAELVKHGRWICFPECLEYEGALDTDYIVCSECHHVWNVIDNCTETFKCCPNCGSRMDGEEE